MQADSWAQIDIVESERRIELKLRGQLSPEYLWQVMSEIEETEGADATFDLLFDGSELEIGDVDVISLSEFEKEVPTSRERLAIVGTSDLHFGIAKMYAAWSAELTSREVQIFRGLEEARVWLRRD
ncbi:MAG: hypothetical protein GKR90_13700 [Pseudomonadales bacterium]|nr:hypothetical protein [Pseudomonadales bacterium]